MKDWVINEFYTFLELISRRPSIVWVPMIGVVLGLILIIYLDHNLANYLSTEADSMFRPIVVKVYEKQHHKAEYLAVILPAIEFFRRYRKARKYYRY